MKSLYLKTAESHKAKDIKLRPSEIDYVLRSRVQQHVNVFRLFAEEKYPFFLDSRSKDFLSNIPLSQRNLG